MDKLSDEGKRILKEKIDKAFATAFTEARDSVSQEGKKHIVEVIKLLFFCLLN